mmetsp:Transcript_138006/g.384974  ORF Transcript_138006/g.384974 Transcript_138006/m.384974 type:complete len:465 (+) Transcript_138006:434-1828(+)
MCGSRLQESSPLWDSDASTSAPGAIGPSAATGLPAGTLAAGGSGTSSSHAPGAAAAAGRPAAATSAGGGAATAAATGGWAATGSADIAPRGAAGGSTAGVSAGVGASAAASSPVPGPRAAAPSPAAGGVGAGTRGASRASRAAATAAAEEAARCCPEACRRCRGRCNRSRSRSGSCSERPPSSSAACGTISPPPSAGSDAGNSFLAPFGDLEARLRSDADMQPLCVGDDAACSALAFPGDREARECDRISWHPTAPCPAAGASARAPAAAREASERRGVGTRPTSAGFSSGSAHASDPLRCEGVTSDAATPAVVGLAARLTSGTAGAAHVAGSRVGEPRAGSSIAVDGVVEAAPDAGAPAGGGAPTRCGWSDESLISGGGIGGTGGITPPGIPRAPRVCPLRDWPRTTLRQSASAKLWPGCPWLPSTLPRRDRLGGSKGAGLCRCWCCCRPPKRGARHTRRPGS